MNQIETNIYLIENPAQLNCNYRIYQIRGLSPDSEDYDKNAQFLETTLRRNTESPCVVFKKDDNTYVAQPEGFEELPSSLDLVRTAVKIEKMPQLEELKFDSLNPVTARLALEFLQWSIQSKFYNNPWLWQPRAGYPFYNKSPDQEFRLFSNDVDLLRGFTFRVVLLPDRRIGVCIDVSSKYVSRHPLPTKIDRKDFNNKFQGLNCLYEYGNRWYEIRIEGISDFDVSSLTLPPNGISLFDDIHQKAGNYKSPNLFALPKNCSVLIYYTTFREARHAPSGLCRLTYTTDHPQVKQFHSRTIKPPHARRKEIQFVVERNFRDLAFGSNKIILSEKPLNVDEKRFIVPDLEFGKGKIVSVRKTPNAIPSSLDELAFKKRDLMYSNEAGLFVKKPFDLQYLILPKSVYDSFGKKFIEDMKNEVQRLYTIEDRIVYTPTVITYNDSVQKIVPAFGRAIIDAVEENNVGSGFGLVMIPEIRSKRFRKEDELANLVMRELRERDIFVSIIHNTVPMESYEYVASENENERWRLVSNHKQQGIYKGYLRNVVLNKILILNCCWPFVLKTSLNADLVIGIDVKNRCAGFTAIHKNGADITFYPSESEQKERLTKNHICTKIIGIITNEQKLSRRNISNIAIHRQGKLFPPERDGIIQALNRLAKDKIIPQGHKCTLVEVKTTSRVPFRLFYVSVFLADQTEMIYNPTIGTYVPFSENEAFVCNTGPPFKHKGTTKPLHVIKIEGSTSLNDIVEDVFYLSNLTWTKIDDCSRQPLSVKMNDIRLREIAGEYDRDALRFTEEEA